MRLRVAPKRRELFKRMLEPHVAGQPAARQRQACAVLQLLFSPRAWDSLEENWGFTGKEAADACAWAIRSLIDSLDGGARGAAAPDGTKRTTKEKHDG
jgi:hypothetical protein